MGVGAGYFSGFTEVQADLLCATAEGPGCEPLLKPEHTHGCGCLGERSAHNLALETAPNLVL